MGTFDYVEFPGQYYHAQIKAWDRGMRTYHVGDPVPIINLKPHSIKTEEGYGWINIKDRCIESLTDEPLYDELYDKWGNLLNGVDDETPMNNPVMQAILELEKQYPDKF